MKQAEHRPKPYTAVAFLLAGLCATPDLTAQTPTVDPAGSSSAHSRLDWRTEVHLFGINAALGGVVAGAGRVLTGGRFLEGAKGGLAGGAVAYIGRRVAVEDFSGSGFLGRQISAVGASVTRNAVEGEPAVGELVLPLGPTRLYLRRDGGEWSVRPKLDLAAFAFAATAMFRQDMEVDWGASTSSGAMVIRTREVIAPQASGLALAGTILIRDDLAGEEGRVIAHERVHVLQRDLTFHVLGERLEAWLMTRDRGLAAIYRYVDVGLLYPVLESGLWGTLGVPHAKRPAEREAEALEAGW